MAKYAWKLLKLVASLAALVILLTLFLVGIMANAAAEAIRSEDDDEDAKYK